MNAVGIRGNCYIDAIVDDQQRGKTPADFAKTQRQLVELARG